MPSTPEEVTKDAGLINTIFEKAARIFLARNSKYKSAFRVGGVVDNAFQIRHKAIRMLQKAQDYEHFLADPESYVKGYGRAAEPPEIDDAYDLINYAAFLIICINQNIWPRQLDEAGEVTPLDLDDGFPMEFWVVAKYSSIEDHEPVTAHVKTTLWARESHMRPDGAYILATAWTGTCKTIFHDGTWYTLKDAWHGTGGDFLWMPPEGLTSE